RIDGVPPGRWTVYAWRRGVTEPASAAVEVGAGGVAQVELLLDVKRDDTAHLNKFGEPYREADQRYRQRGEHLKPRARRCEEPRGSRCEAAANRPRRSEEGAGWSPRPTSDARGGARSASGDGVFRCSPL